jgi:hypothetical protein
LPKEHGKPGRELGDVVQGKGVSQDAEQMAKELGDPLPDHLCHHISLHGNVFWVCTVVMQPTIKKGELLFPVEYKD